MERGDEKKPGSFTPVAVAAALAMLGLSVGVNVPELFSASPQDAIESKHFKVSPGASQGKIESLQSKTPGSLQQKVQPIQGTLPAVQNKPTGVVK